MIKQIAIKLGLLPPKCSYCEQSEDEGYYYFCSLEHLVKYVKGGWLDKDKQNGDQK
jgi:hypothetical protein